MTKNKTISPTKIIKELQFQLKAAEAAIVNLQKTNSEIAHYAAELERNLQEKRNDHD